MTRYAAGGGPQMVEVSRDGRRVYFTNSLYGAWDDQFYPDGVGAWMAKLDADPDGGLSIDDNFFPHGESSAACGCTRSGCRVATLRRTPTATADSHLHRQISDIAEGLDLAITYLTPQYDPAVLQPAAAVVSVAYAKVDIAFTPRAGRPVRTGAVMRTLRERLDEY